MAGLVNAFALGAAGGAGTFIGAHVAERYVIPAAENGVQRAAEAYRRLQADGAFHGPIFVDAHGDHYVLIQDRRVAVDRDGHRVTNYTELLASMENPALMMIGTLAGSPVLFAVGAVRMLCNVVIEIAPVVRRLTM
jgi:hypothetical protein